MGRKILWFVLLFLSIQVPSVQGYGWGFKPSTDEMRPDIGKYEQLIADHLAYYAQNTNEKQIYLTFDNGYEQGYTASILSVLKKHQVAATFFVTGHYIESEPELVKQMVDDGHIIGNHSYHHPDFTSMNKKAIEEELIKVDKAIEKITSQKETIYVRPPRGTFNEETLRWIEELGYIHVFWSLAFKDWEVNKQRGWEYAYNQIMKQVHPGAIILLHTVSEDNALALEKAIVALKKRGYQFKSLDEFMIEELSEGILF